MASATRYSRSRIHLAICGSLCLAGFAISPAFAGESSVDIGTVQATATGNGEAPEAKKVHSATYQAPSKTPLKVSQPTSVVSQHYIEHNVATTANYDDMIQHTPSVSSVGPNGPGLMENMGLSIRGFQDGQFNVTFDGMPWGDSNDFTHHSTSYFMAHDITQASVDRGPGTAATVGTATFGGTIALQSKTPSTVSSLNPYMTQGSFNTQLYGVEYDTGVLPQYGGATALIDAESLTSDGYLTYSAQKRRNVFLKVMRPIGDNTSITFSAMYDYVHQNVPIGATKAQIAEFGPNYGLSNDPTKQNYFGYNYDNIHTDFEYIDLQSFVNGWNVDNKLYTYAYYHRGQNGLDPNGETPNGTSYSPTDVPGEKMAMNYRSFGDFARFALPTEHGTWNTGVWLDHQYNTRWQYLVDWTLGGALNPNDASATERLMTDSMDNLQPYVEYAWQPTDKLKITPGLKYAFFRRHLNAEVNQKTAKPLNYNKTWSSLLPSIDLHYHIQPHWVAYAQVAKGFLAPNLNTFYVADPGQNSVKPEQTWNYQVGTSWQHQRLSLSGDLYYIDFNNYISKAVSTVGDTYYHNEGGVIYKGIEVEGTYYVGSGFSFYGNGSANDAKTKKDNVWVTNTPKDTAALGVVYNQDNWYGSLMDKFIGQRYGDDGETQPLGGYSVTNASLSYTFRAGTGDWLQKARVNFQIYNLFNNKSINALAGYTVQDNTPLYWTIPERSYNVTL